MTEKCPFCGLDPFERVNVGIGSVPVAVNCCQFGVALYQEGEPYEEVAEAFKEYHGHETPERDSDDR